MGELTRALTELTQRVWALRERFPQPSDPEAEARDVADVLIDYVESVGAPAGWNRDAALPVAIGEARRLPGALPDLRRIADAGNIDPLAAAL